MEWWDIFVAVLFVIGVTAYPGWNLVIRMEFRYANPIKVLSKPFNPKVLSKPFNQIKILSKPSRQINELEKIFGA